MNRGQYILRRLAQMIPVLFGITLVVFALLQLIPGDPATTMLGLQARPEAVAALRHELGLDRAALGAVPALSRQRGHVRPRAIR